MTTDDVASYADGLEELAAWLREHPDVEAALTHAEVDIHCDKRPKDEAIALFGLMAKHLTDHRFVTPVHRHAVMERQFGPVRLRAKIPAAFLPSVQTGKVVPETTVRWPS